MIFIKKKQRAQAMLEIVIALGLFGLGMTVVTSILVTQVSSTQRQAQTLSALTFAEEGLEAVRIIRNRDWLSLRPGTFGLDIYNNHLIFKDTPDQKGGLTRTITITEIDGVTKKIESAVSWKPTPRINRSIILKTELTDWWPLGRGETSGDWKNPIFIQPTTPLKFNGGATGVAVRDRLAYITVSPRDDNKKDFYIVDVVNPYSPKILGSIDVSYEGLDDVALYENYALAAGMDDDYQLFIIDISNPATPTMVSKLAVERVHEDAKTVAVSYPYAYVGTYASKSLNVTICHEGVTIVVDESSVPAHLEHGDSLGSCETGGGNETNGTEFLVVDITNPAAPKAVAGLDIGNNIQDIFLRDHYAYLAVSQGKYPELVIVDIANPLHPSVVGQYNPSSGHPGYGIFIKDNGAGVLVRYGGSGYEFITLDFSVPTMPAPRGFLNVSGDLHKVLLKDNIAFTTNDTSPELRIFDITNPTNPALSTNIDLSDNAEGIAFERNYLYVAVRDSRKPLAIITAE